MYSVYHIRITVSHLNVNSYTHKLIFKQNEKDKQPYWIKIVQDNNYM